MTPRRLFAWTALATAILMIINVSLQTRTRISNRKRVRSDRRIAVDTAAIAEAVNTAAEAAVRAVHKCTPLEQLPPLDYNEWREIRFTFDPRDLVGE